MLFFENNINAVFSFKKQTCVAAAEGAPLRLFWVVRPTEHTGTANVVLRLRDQPAMNETQTNGAGRKAGSVGTARGVLQGGGGENQLCQKVAGGEGVCVCR